MKKNLMYTAVLAGVVALVVYVAFYIGMTKSEPEFEIGSSWASSNPQINFVVNDDGVPCGEVGIDGINYELFLYTKGGDALLFIREGRNSEERFFAVGNFRMKSDTIIIKNIEYLENLCLDVDEIILKKVDG